MSTKRYIPAGMEDDDEEEFQNSILKTCENMKITIVPDITIKSGLNGENFDATLSQEIDVWFDNFKQMWNIYKNSSSLSKTLGTFYLTSSDPLTLALKLFANCPGCNNVKTKTLPLLIMEELAVLKQSNQDVAAHCTDNMRMVAFNFVKCQGLPNLYKAVTIAYDLKKSKDLFESKIHELISQHYYKDASHWAILLELTDKFSIFDIVLPLMLQDKISVAEEYLEAVPSLQYPTVELLDSLLNRTYSVLNNCDFYIAKYNYTDVRTEKLQTKPLTKLVARLARKYRISVDATPHMNRAKSYGYLQYLIHKKYVEKSLNNESWRELVSDTLTVNCKEMHIDLIYSISYHNDIQECAYWANFYKVSIESLPLSIQDYLNFEQKSNNFMKESWDDNLSGTQEKSGDNSNDKDSFYSLTLDNNNIILVNNKNSFKQMMMKLTVQNEIAFDSEWKPSCNAGNIVSLIQISTWKEVYLIDALTQNLSDELWSELGRNVFNNGEILKLGFALSSDLFMFQKTIPSLNISLQFQTSYLDLQVLWKKLNSVPRFQFPFQEKFLGSHNNISLSTLAELCVGKKLDKSNQLSNWGNRPLRKEQLLYAALDAYCLLEIYDVINNQLTNLSLDINDFLDDTMIDKKLLKSKKKFKLKPMVTEKCDKKSPPGSSTKPVRVTDVKFICDEMLEGLAKSLRKCGIDGTVISSKRDWQVCAERALQENRILLTKGFVNAKYLPRDYCYNVQQDLVDDQLVEVLNYFNIMVNEKDVFSRCQNCNSNEFILATKADIIKIKHGILSTDSKTESLENKVPQRSFVLRKISPDTLTTHKTTKGAHIKIDQLRKRVVETVELFYICDGCGKLYWEGDNFKRAISGSLKDIISKN